MSHRNSDAFNLQTTKNSNDGVTPSGTYMNGQNAIAANTTFAPFSCKQLDAFSLQFSTPAGSTLVGTLTLQVSDDRGAGVSGDGQPDANLLNWTPAITFWDVVAGATATSKAVASGAQSFMISTGPHFCTYRWARLVFAFTSGTGNPTITVQQKAYE